MWIVLGCIALLEYLRRRRKKSEKKEVDTDVK